MIWPSHFIVTLCQGVNKAILKNIGAEKDDKGDSDCNMGHVIYVVFLLKYSVYFVEELIANVKLAFTRNKLTGNKIKASA